MEILIQWKYYWKIILSSFSSFLDLFYVIEWSLSPSSHEFYQPSSCLKYSQRGNYGGRDRSPNRRNNYRQRSRSRSPRRNRQGASSDRNERRPHKRLRVNSPLPRGERWAFMKSSSSYSLLTSTFYNILSSKFMRVIVSIMCNSSAIVTWWLLKPSNVIVYKM